MINNPELYSKAKKIADETYSKPSAYKSGFIVKTYKDLGGTYSDDGKPKELKRWFKEEWKDIGNKEYPVYRPTKRVSKATPLTASEIDPVQAQSQIALKQVIKGSKNLPPFLSGGNVFSFLNGLKYQSAHEDEELRGGGRYAITPFGRIGGKSKLAKQLIGMFPPTDAYDTYVEPFVGAGNILFRLLPEGHKEVINDIDKKVIIALKGIKNRGAYINANVARKGLTREEFDKKKNLLDPVSIIDTYKHSFFTMGTFYNDSYPNGTDYTKMTKRLKDVTILNESFEKVIKKYDGERTFFYLDPPYESDNLHYQHTVSPEMVFDSVKNAKGYVMVSYNDSKKIRQLFKGWNITVVKKNYVRGVKGNVNATETKELVIRNY
jgi:DNA adenine methylase